jgi:transcriptional regulator with PAS, ATPase and Fis domain
MLLIQRPKKLLCEVPECIKRSKPSEKRSRGQPPEAKKRKRIPHQWRRPEEKQRALERMRETGNISQLAKELGIPRRTLYAWRDQAVAKAQQREQKPKTRNRSWSRD